MSISREDGMRVEEPGEVKKEIVDYFQRLLGCAPPCSPGNLDTLRKALPRRLTTSQSNHMLRGVPKEEIKSVLFSLKDNKAPGPDGYKALFFKKPWDIVGNDVVSAIKSFFASGCLLKEVNATTIALIPKVPNPTLKDFRPISCCNKHYLQVYCEAYCQQNETSAASPCGKTTDGFCGGEEDWGQHFAGSGALEELP